jgi:L-alanine-DL-glutamate epimerase-like enolase superfamily enzyme
VKITRVTCDYLTLPLTIPVRESEREYGIVLVTIETDAGHRGVGLARNYDEQGLATRQVVLNDLAPFLERFGDVVTPGHLWHEAMFELPGTFYRQPEGVLNTAMSAVDQALWDVRGQALGEPVYKLLGGAQDEIEVYVTFGFNIYTPDEEIEAAKRAQAKGFRAFKLQGVDDRGGNVAAAAARVRRLRETVGDDAQIILDAHNNYSVYEAIELARLVRPYTVAYIDEPVHARDPAAMRRLHDAATGVRLAGRSRGGSLIDNRDLVDSGGLDLLGQNVIDQGGYTQGIKAAALAEARQLPVVTGGAWHLQNAHLIAAVTNGWMTEYHVLAAALCDAIFTGHVQPSAGRLRMSQRPGLGLALNDDAVADAKDRALRPRRR